MTLFHRPSAAYTTKHIVTSWNLPTPTGGGGSSVAAAAGGAKSADAIRASLLQLIATTYDINPPEQLSTVIVCYDAESSTDVVDYAAAVAAELSRFGSMNHDGESSSSSSGGNGNGLQHGSPEYAVDPTEHYFASSLFKRMDRVGLFDGTAAFCDAYPCYAEVGPGSLGLMAEDEAAAAAAAAACSQPPILPAMICAPMSTDGGTAALPGALYLGSQTHCQWSKQTTPPLATKNLLEDTDGLLEGGATQSISDLSMR